VCVCVDLLPAVVLSAPRCDMLSRCVISDVVPPSQTTDGGLGAPKKKESI